MKQLEMIDNSNVQMLQNRALLNMLNRDLLQLKNGMYTVGKGFKALEFSKIIKLAMLQVRNGLATICDGMENLKDDLTKIFQYMTSLTTYKVTLTLIPPMGLRRILEDVTMKLVANPKLALPVAKNADIWSYYQFLKIDVFVHRDMLIVILILPYFDKDLQFDLFKAHKSFTITSLIEESIYIQP